MKQQLIFAALTLLLAMGCNQQEPEQSTMNKEKNELG